MHPGLDIHPARSFHREGSAIVGSSSIARAKEKHTESCSQLAIEAIRRLCPYRLECSQDYGNDRPRVRGFSVYVVSVPSSELPGAHRRQARRPSLVVEKQFWIS